MLGRAFIISAGLVIATSLVACTWRLADPLSYCPPGYHLTGDQAADFAHRERLFGALLGAVAIYTLVPLVFAIQVVRTRRQPDQLSGTWTKLLLGMQVVTSLALIAYMILRLMGDRKDWLDVMVLGVGLGALVTAWWDYRFVAKPQFAPMFWWYKHMEFMLRTGIAFHTAFIVFGLKPWVGMLGSGPWALVPWVLPSVVGVPAAWLWIRYYQRKFGDLSAPSHPVAVVGLFRDIPK